MQTPPGEGVRAPAPRACLEIGIRRLELKKGKSMKSERVKREGGEGGDGSSRTEAPEGGVADV